MFNPSVYENSRPDGISVLEISSSEQLQENQPRQFVPLKRTELKGEIAGPLASLRLTQIYGYSKEQCDKVLEALYRFPLPGDAAVTGVLVRFGGIEIRTELKEREKAEADYEQARQQGQQAVLLTRESPEVFTLQVAGIQPEQEVTIETSYVQLARPEGVGWSLRIPLTTAPRYVRSDEITSRHAQGQPLLLLRDPGHRFSLDLTMRETESAESATHRLEVSREDGQTRVRLHEGEIIPDRDCVLSWKPQQQQDRPDLQAMYHNDPASGQVFFLALVTPPAIRDASRAVPREVTLLVDHSGSMRGPKWEAADWAVKRFLSDLTHHDVFALGLFHTTTKWFSKELVQADQNTVAAAIRFLEGNRDSGGTELGVALEQALSLKRMEEKSARHLLIVTDAQVTDEGRLLRLASEEAKRFNRRRISTLCIDAAPNSFLASELAERGGGVAKFLTSNPQEEDITTALDEVMTHWSEPVLAGLRLEINRAEAQAIGHEMSQNDQSGWSAIDLGDMPAKRSIWVAGRVPAGDNTMLSFRLTTPGDPEVATQRLRLSEENGKLPALKALFGARRILGLEFLIHSGYAGKDLSTQLERLGYDTEKVLADPSGTPPKSYAENVRADAMAALRTLLVKEALDYGLACSETAFVAVRQEAGKLVEAGVAIGNALPAGWSESFLSGSSAVLFAGVASPQSVAPTKARVLRFMKMSAASLTFKARGVKQEFAARRRYLVDVEKVVEPRIKTQTLFSGLPQFLEREAILFDSSRPEDGKKLPEAMNISLLEIRFPAGKPSPENMDPDLSLLVFVGDLAAPRAKVRLMDLIRQGLKRPLHLSRQSGDVVRLVLHDPNDAWKPGAPTIEILLGW